MAEDAPSSSSTSTTASGSENNEEYPTRFRFYEPQIIKLDDGDRHPNRFSFYDARQELTPVENIPDDSTDEILRSLQETEVQRLNILNTDPSAVVNQPMVTDTTTTSSNPYEDAIKEALELLRKHRSPPGTPAASSAPPVTVSVKTAGIGNDDRSRTPRDQDRLLKHRMDEPDDNVDDDLVILDATLPASAKSPELLADAYEEHKLKAKQRQQRMAQYASRLEEFKSSLPAVTQRDMQDKLPHSHSGDYSDLSHSTKEQVEAEVQRGVERVLLAILERANASRERSAQASLPDDNTSPSITSDALIRAMDELGLKNDSREHLNLKSKTSGETDRTGVGSKRSVGTSVVDELLAEDEDDDIIEHDDIFDDKTSQITSVPISSPNGLAHKHLDHLWGHREEKKLPDSQEKTKTYHTIEEENEVDRLMDECLRSQSENEDYHDEASHDDHDRMKGVLGPLSKDGCTTGVVLDSDGEEYSHASKRREIDYLSVNTKHKVPYTSGMKYFTPSTATQDDDEDSIDRTLKSHDDKYSTMDEATNTIEDDDDVDDDDDRSEDFEATELMRTLCAHFLPFGVDQTYNRLIEAIPEWDESNPNEAGYRIIRLTRTQLQRVELAFEKMVNGLKLKSEQQLGAESGDAQFARELVEVERLLDESEERRHKTTDAVKPPKDTKPKPANADFSKEKQELSFILDDDDDCHPNFPGVKATGKGEMGDLEYFHLPIIFKSHVTGFEPTKDLVLEPGNVVAGQYLVENELGSAAFSTAYRCIDLSTESEDVSEVQLLKDSLLSRKRNSHRLTFVFHIRDMRKFV